MRSFAFVVLGLALLSTVYSDDTIDDPEGDGALGANNSQEELIVSGGLMRDLRLQTDPSCVLLDSTDTEPTKHLLDINENSICNDYENELWGECNCPDLHLCEYEGAVQESRIYYCRDVEGSPSGNDNYGHGLLLGELEEARVVIAEGLDKK